MKNGHELIANWLKNARGDAIITIDGKDLTAAEYAQTKPLKQAKQAKFNNKITYVDGIKFDSKAEADRYCELKLMERAGLIKIVKLQPVFELQAAFTRNGKTHRAINYIADFMYLDLENKQVIVEDVKGGKATATQSFKNKMKMFIKKYPEYIFRIEER